MISEKAREKLQSVIDSGRGRVTNTLGDIQREWDERRDVVVRPSAWDIGVFEGALVPMVDGQSFGWTDHAKRQLCDRAGVPVKFAETLAEWNEGKLVQDTFKTAAGHNTADGLLIRSVDGTIKGVLSPSYRRMDASPIFQAFFQSGEKAGMVPHDGMMTEARYHLSSLWPEIYEIANDAVVFGMSLTTSDYGAAALEVRMWLMRVVCTNLALGFDAFRKVHLGKRFVATEDTEVLSQRTYDLDSATLASAIMDIGSTAPQYIHALKSMILQGSESQPKNIKDVIAAMRKRGIKKEIAEKVNALYDAGDIEELPKEKSSWRLSNVISFVAKNWLLRFDDGETDCTWYYPETEARRILEAYGFDIEKEITISYGFIEPVVDAVFDSPCCGAQIERRRNGDEVFDYCSDCGKLVNP